MLSLVKLIIAVVLAFLGAAFAIINDQPVALDLYFVVTRMPLSLALLLAMGLGLVLGALVSTFYFMQLRKENARLRRQARMAEQEVKNLRTLPLNGR
ncbi:MAG: LapA family protein [Gammaproteobacteria bacterium]|nr:MAG: LapA family protein [Gammaproteobacteria bacterium]